MLSEGRLLNLGNATGHPSFVMSNSFTNQTIAQVELFTKNDEYERQVYVLPKHLDEKVARLHLDALGVRLTELRKDQAEYIGVDVAGAVQERDVPLLDRSTARRPSPCTWGGGLRRARDVGTCARRERGAGLAHVRWRVGHVPVSGAGPGLHVGRAGGTCVRRGAGSGSGTCAARGAGTRAGAGSGVPASAQMRGSRPPPVPAQAAADQRRAHVRASVLQPVRINMSGGGTGEAPLTRRRGKPQRLSPAGA